MEATLLREEARTRQASLEPAVSTIATKRTLAAMSSAIQRVAHGAAPEAIVIALFQRGAHFAPMAPVYSELAGLGLTVVVGYAGEALDAPGVVAIALTDAEPLADEWSVIVLAPTFAAYVVGTDLRELDVTGSTLENRRRFRASWGFDRTGGAEHARRILAGLDDRLPADIVELAEAAIAHARTTPNTAAEIALGQAALCLVASLDETSSRLDNAKIRLDRETQHATTDALTGLMNREGLRRWLGGSSLDGVDMPLIGLVMIDLDGFKTVNDTYGHDIGDEVLRAVARALSGCTRPGDIVTRWGGDEFVVLCPGAEGDELEHLALRMIAAVAAVSVGSVRIGASAGTESSRKRPLALRAADAAMYAAKRAGGSRVVAI